MARKLGLVLALIACAGVYLHWPTRAPAPAPIEAAEFGPRTDKSLVLVEPALEAHDYRSAAALRMRLGAYLDTAKAKGFLTGKTVVVFPEYVGAFLVAADAPALASRARTVGEASLAVIADDPIGFTVAFGHSSEEDRLSAALFRSRSEAMARDYVEVFATLAREYGVVIVAGSTIIENPRVESGRLISAPGPLRNVSAVFAADGSLLAPLVEKRRLIPSETRFAEGGRSAIPVFETSAGRLGVLICADSWHGELYEELRAHAPDMVVAPAFIEASAAWDAPWGGYVTGWPDDAAQTDAGAISEGEAWMRYALPGRLAASGAGAGGTAFLMGAPWDIPADGRTLAASNGRAFIGEQRRSGVTALWR
jgi:predicted amidohydrolase